MDRRRATRESMIAGRRRETELVVISYDVEDDRHRNRVHDVLIAHGTWVQYSVFECFLTQRELVQLRGQLLALIDVKTDSVRIYRLCGSCERRIEVIGGEPPREAVAYIT